MLSFAKSTRLFGDLRRAGFFVRRQSCFPSFATASFLGRNLVTFRRLATPHAHANRSPATFSTHSAGLRGVSWAESRPGELEIARAVAPPDDKSPFSYADAHVVLFTLEGWLVDPETEHDRSSCIGNQLHEKEAAIARKETAMARYGGVAAIVQQELDKVVSSVGKTEQWPVVVTCGHYDPMICSFGRSAHIFLKLPTIMEPQGFAKRLTDAGQQSLVKITWLQGKEETGASSQSRNKSWRHGVMEKTTNVLGIRSYATLAPNHPKERPITWRGVTEEQEKENARADFHRSNPFNDPKAHNCVMIIPNVPFVIEYGEHKVIKTHELFEPQAAIVGTEVSKLLAKAGKPETTWPVIWELDDNDMHLYFKLPHGEDLAALEARMLQAGLVGGRFEELGSEWDEWWYSTLHYLVKKGLKMR